MRLGLDLWYPVGFSSAGSAVDRPSADQRAHSMSQRLVNIVCMIFTLAAAMYLYVFMHEYSITGSTGVEVPEWDEADSRSDRAGKKPDTDAMPMDSIEYGRQSNRAELPSRPLDFD